MDSRLNFPIPGDSSLFINVGRKHYDNHSDRMHRILLPEKYAANQPNRVPREYSVPPPHLVRHTSERIFENREQINEDVRKIFAKETSLREKIEDELDKMRRSMDRQKRSVILPAAKEKERVEEVKEKVVPSSSGKVERASSPKLGSLFSLTPAVSIKVESKTKSSGPHLLYNP